jgi:type 1 glutamine amidotransferase
MTIAPGAKVIATALSATQRGGTGREEPMLVVTRFGQGRGFYTALGHELPAMAEPGFRSTFLRGTEWAASGKVTLPANAGSAPAPTATTDDLRVLVVTGGHDFDPAFYTLFEDQPGLRWRHAVSQHDAFRTDLRRSTDVVVLYDMASDLDPQGRTHLRAYLESGGGLVVLHHALADLQDWEWWWKDVVGGRYVLKAEPGHPGSDFLHDQWMEITPADAHPVTDGIGALRLFDETYKRVWQSPGIRPLLTTTNPTSDPVVGWVGPWPHARVVCLQPGHGPETHRHPAYRALLAQAIRWTAAGPRTPAPPRP